MTWNETYTKEGIIAVYLDVICSDTTLNTNNGPMEKKIVPPTSDTIAIGQCIFFTSIY
jgi:hypothetical protein